MATNATRVAINPPNANSGTNHWATFGKIRCVLTSRVKKENQNATKSHAKKLPHGTPNQPSLARIVHVHKPRRIATASSAKSRTIAQTASAIGAGSARTSHKNFSRVVLG